MGKGHISSKSATPPSQGCGPQNSPVFGVPFYLCVQSLPQNYHIWRSNTYGEEACLKGVSHAPPKGGKALVSSFVDFLPCQFSASYALPFRHGQTDGETTAINALCSHPMCFGMPPHPMVTLSLRCFVFR